MKKITAIFLLIICILSFTSCSPGKADDITSSASDNTISRVETKQDKFNIFPRGGASSASEETTIVSDIAADDVKGLEGGASYSASDIFPEQVSEEFISKDGFCYNAINDTQKSIYRRMDKIAAGMHTGFVVLGKYEMSDIVVAFSALRTDHPEYYWLSNQFACGYFSGNTAVAFDYKNDNIDISYLCTAEERTSFNAKLKYALEKFLSSLSDDMSEYQKELLLHDALLSSIVYDKAAAADSSNNPFAFTAYGALVNGTAICEGYSRAFQLLMKCVGIDCTLITGSSKEQGHMWNKVKIENEWYNVDATWDDDDTYIFHTYFNISDKMIANDHDVHSDYSELSIEQLEKFDDFNIALPDCTALNNNYGMINKSYISSRDVFADVTSIVLVEKAKNGIREAEFVFGEDCPLVFSLDGDNSITDLLEDDGVLRGVNKRLSRSNSINNIYISGVPGSKGFLLKW